MRTLRFGNDLIRDAGALDLQHDSLHVSSVFYLSSDPPVGQLSLQGIRPSGVWINFPPLRLFQGLTTKDPTLSVPLALRVNFQILRGDLLG